MKNIKDVLAGIGIYRGGTVARIDDDAVATQEYRLDGKTLKKIAKLKQRANWFKGALVGLQCPQERRATAIAENEKMLAEILDQIDDLYGRPRKSHRERKKSE